MPSSTRSASSALEFKDQAGTATRYSSPRILAVDDRHENLMAIEAAFSHSGYEIVLASSGLEAVALTKTNDFAAILLDVQMPVLDGFETAKQIRQLDSSKNIPIIFVTAIDRKETNEYKGYVSGAVDFLYKPLDTEILLAKVGVFVELYRAKKDLQQQSELLREKALQEQENRLLQRGIEARDEFLTIASHELNTPLTPLSLQMEAFLKIIADGKLESTDPERLKRMLEIAFGQVGRLARIVGELVDVSRITTGKFRLVPKRTNLADVVKSVKEEFDSEIQQLGYKVDLIIKSEPIGKWDDMRIEQIIVNLLSNALKYGLGNPIEIIVEHFSNCGRVTVKDGGIGIASEDQQRIFERFERAVSPTNYGGLGLGLYIANQIARLHRGNISVSSDLGISTQFVVDLPLEAL